MKQKKKVNLKCSQCGTIGTEIFKSSKRLGHQKYCMDCLKAALLELPQSRDFKTNIPKAKDEKNYDNQNHSNI